MSRKTYLMPIIILLLIFNLVLLASSEELKIMEKGSARYEITISSDAKAIGRIKDLEAYLALYPENSKTQIVKKVTTRPESTNNIFKWGELFDQKVEFELNAEIETTFYYPKIREKIRFPVNINENLEYLDSSPAIDIQNPSIRKLAEELASGEDDLMQFIYKTAKYVEENIEYSLDSVTDKASKPASWVLENKRGVCDELTNLFIAIMRASGIPARFVSGIAYTDSDLFARNWGPHGWAEIYVPRYGWIPVDVTYKQIGWLDVGHIKLRHSKDATDPSISYKWKGDRVAPGEINFKVKVVEISGKPESPAKIRTKVFSERSGFGSYNQFEVELTNPNNFYVPLTIHIAKSDSIELLDKNFEAILLIPNEDKKVNFKFKIKDNLKQDYKYTSYIKANILGDSSASQIVSTKSDPVLESSKFVSNENLEEKNTEMRLQKNPEKIHIKCEQSKNIAHINDTIDINCVINSKFGKEQEIDFCIQSCKKIIVGTGMDVIEKTGYFVNRTGKQDIRIIASNSDVFKIEYLPLDVIRAPEIKFSFNYPEKIRYNDFVNVSLTITEQFEEINETRVMIYLNKKLLKEDQINNLQVHKYLLTIPPGEFRNGENDLAVEVRFFDRAGKEYTQKDFVVMKLGDLTFLQRGIVFLRSLL